MRIYLMRHATAEDSGSGPDASRRLSEYGRREAREAGKALLEHNASIAIILSSPLIRAQETAELIAAELRGVLVEIRTSLASGATNDEFQEEIQSQMGRDVVLVGHNPDLSTFASTLCRQAVGFRPGTLCCFEWVESGATLLWVHHPSP